MDMTPEARRHALELIAREHVLTCREALDTLGTPIVLRPAPANGANVSRLRQIAAGIVQNLPADVADSIPDLAESDATPAIGGVGRDSGVLLWVVDLRAQDGTPWVGFFCGTMYANQEEFAPPEDLSSTINNLNLNDATDAWVSMEVAGERLMVRLCGSAHKVDGGLEGWYELAAYLITVAVAAGEDAESNEAAPASTYLELLDMSQRGADNVYSEASLIVAATTFRDSFSEELARTVLLDDHLGGVGVLIPFLAGGEAHALLTVFEAVSDEESPTGVGGVKIFGRLYDNLPISAALRWARTFNGDDVPSYDNDIWTQTTAWLYGSWQALEVLPGLASVFYKGFVSNTLRRHVDDVDLIRGCVQEMWVSASRYRLSEEFDSAIGGVDGLR